MPGLVDPIAANIPGLLILRLMRRFVGPNLTPTSLSAALLKPQIPDRLPSVF